jgi:hypothetical protein
VGPGSKLRPQLNSIAAFRFRWFWTIFPYILRVIPDKHHVDAREKQIDIFVSFDYRWTLQMLFGASEYFVTMLYDGHGSLANGKRC